MLAGHFGLWLVLETYHLIQLPLAGCQGDSDRSFLDHFCKDYSYRSPNYLVTQIADYVTEITQPMEVARNEAIVCLETVKYLAIIFSPIPVADGYYRSRCVTQPEFYWCCIELQALLHMGRCCSMWEWFSWWIQRSRLLIGEVRPLALWDDVIDFCSPFGPSEKICEIVSVLRSFSDWRVKTLLRLSDYSSTHLEFSCIWMRRSGPARSFTDRFT